MLDRKELNLPKYPEKIIQFGEGNFLRCFFDWQIDILNKKQNLNAGVAVVRPIDYDTLPLLNTQDGLYTAIIRGINEEGKAVKNYRIVSSVNREIPVYKEFDEFLKLAHNPEMRFIVSNTTEAGIVYSDKDKYEDRPQNTYPAKLTRLLHERFKHFNGDKTKGFILMPCELIDYNGIELKKIVLKYTHLWKLEDEFITWLDEANIWCSTLVDRIVTGYPRAEKDELEKELKYEDKFMVTGEYFYLFVIQGPKDILTKELHLENSGLNVVIVDDLKPYKMRKVGILNGAHTAMVPVAYLYGIDTVREAMENDEIRTFIDTAIDQEIIPAIDMDKKELIDFKNAVIDRFKNPYVKHMLIDIALNSTSKYKTRILPQVLKMHKKTGKLSKKLLFSLAALIRFYKGVRENGDSINLRDDAKFLDLYKKLWETSDYKHIVTTILGMKEHWDIDLNEIPGMTDLVTQYLTSIDTKGIKEALKEVK
ncbi:Altronate oxidoreductase [Fusobacterium sp. DD29]|uniref:tagaturonate reductase n=1 Tax=unclassified Fusobacterium TaxID=2648384 RepID=UPI001D7211B3|nr:MULTISPECIES: tagaturonate reductase [unclassified Fusobacterium]MBR8748610.1 Altronate oxidoreductase [Fusobacterium sp. DD29]MBR8760926.1 Altronate oxidoreductase [Fusobacterium sp. DD25]MBR8766938.1 Altronate oxidoreductase [Fusobacterium sp. DD43]MBR8770890.1 Altronate oxidoreductase [Fusobacterium sp. DD40]MBR8775165.1 Altronate oxidoreductase [Fusobacterium sp. DD17]